MTRTRLRFAALGLAAIALVAGACSSSSDETSTGGSGSASQAEGITITDVWARSLPTGTGAVYLTITSSVDDALTGASVPADIAGTAEIHETMAVGDDHMDDMTDGTMTDGTMHDDDMGDGDMGDMTDGTMDDGSTGSASQGMAGHEDGDEKTDGTMADGAMHDDEMTDGTMAHGGGEMGEMTMQEVDEIPLPAGETVVLEPGGYHIMLLDMPETLEAGATFDLTLTFASGDTQTVTATVRDA